MIEKVNPMHPDKIADRIAGSIVDMAYASEVNPKIAVEVLIGHGKCLIVTESNVKLPQQAIKDSVLRISKENIKDIEIIQTKQDVCLANNQDTVIRCGDNGIFKGVPATEEEKTLSHIARNIYDMCPTDGKYILHNKHLTVCQSHTDNDFKYLIDNDNIIQLKANPLGQWNGGTSVDTGATNRKLGSDMGQSVTGGGLHGKDLSKADVSINIYAFLKAQATQEIIEVSCSIGDEYVCNRPYKEIVEIAREYIQGIGGFEKFAEWGLI